MSQTSYSVLMATAFIGAHGLLTRVVPARNNSGAELPYGRAVQFDSGAGTSELAVKLPASAAGVIQGVSLYDASHEVQTTGIPDDGMLSVVRQGDVFMYNETAVTPTDPVYVRHTLAGATGSVPALGQVRKNPDGAAEVNTVTPTAGNTTLYGLAFNIEGVPYSFEVLSDATATAQEICDAFRTVMAANAAFTAQVVASGAATLILTSQRAGVPQNITVNANTTGTGGLAIAATTPAAPTAVLQPSWKFNQIAAAGAGVWVTVNP